MFTWCHYERKLFWLPPQTHSLYDNIIKGSRNTKLGIAISVTTVFTMATSEFEK